MRGSAIFSFKFQSLDSVKGKSDNLSWKIINIREKPEIKKKKINITELKTAVTEINLNECAQ